MKGLRLIGALVLALFSGAGAAAQSVMFWNLENFYDYRNDSTSTWDTAFSARGEKHWTKRRFQAKCNAVAKGIMWAAGTSGAYPDAIGLEEVENAFVARSIIYSTALSKLDYACIHFDSPDRRGIDVALLYRRSRLHLLDAKPCHIYYPDSCILATRDILCARFVDGKGRHVAILVNHHPSKYGGAGSAPKREAAVKRLAFLADSLARSGVDVIIAGGDFNDTPHNPVLRLVPLENLALPLAGGGFGTIRYQGRWEIIDYAFATEGFRMEILPVPFLVEEDRRCGGIKPLRTYTGPRWTKGVSDHFPIIVKPE